MKEIYFYPGRFQPMGPHHAETFNTVMSKYGAENSYIVTSNKVDFSLKGGVPKSPLNFQEKKAIMIAHGIPGNNIIQVSNPYYVKEVLFNYKPEEVEAVYLVGAKDMAENPRFKKTEGVTKEGYKWRIEVVPHVDKCIGGEEMCGTSTRVALKKGDEKTFKDIMGWFDQDIFNILKKKLNNKDIEEDLYNPEDKVLDYMKSSEWKAGMPDGHKDDIEPGYKYRRGGQYNAASGIGGAGGMYESRGGESELHIYDFDETIARVETPIPYTVESPEGKTIEKGETTSIEFEEKKDFLKNSYDKGIKINWDFKAFSNLISKGTLNNEVFQKLLKSIENPNAKVTILTARAVGLPVTKFLKDQGIWAYVVPLGLNKEKGQPVTGEDKANWIESRIKDTTKKVLFIDDSSENRKAIYTLRDKYPDIKFDVENPLKMGEMIGTMNNQEKAKHAKNLKRLSKDMSNMKGNNYGGGGYKVPDYVKGTLTRKLYELSDKEQEIVDDILSEFNTLNEFDFSKLKSYGKKGLLTLAILLSVASQAPAQNTQDIVDQGIEMVDRDYQKDFNSAMVGLAVKLSNKGSEKQFAGTHTGDRMEEMTVFKEIRHHYEAKRDGKKAIELSPEAKKTSKIMIDLLIKELNKGGLDYYVDFGKNITSKDIYEKVTKDKVICDNCGWDWKIDDGGDDVYMCHKCDHDNTPTNENFPPYKADQVQQTRYKASDIFTRDVKKSKKMGYKESVFSKDWWKTQLTEILSETKANTHLTHLEELVLTQGQDGYNKAKSFLYELIKNLKGESNNIKNVSVKWDGAPAVWAGINPENGKFFVGTKSIFNKQTPKINYTSQDIDTNHGHAAGLVKKLKLALQYLPALGIKGILQGDFMFDSDDVQTEDIDGAAHYTFEPNTIRYAIEANSEIGKKILNAKIGVIWHTTYNSLEEGDFSFGADVSGLSQTPSVWFDDAYFKDDTGILLSDKEEEFVLDKIKEADSLNVDYDNLPDEISSRAKTNLLNTYLNSEVRIGEFITDPNKSFERFKNWYQQAVDKSIEKVKRPESKERKRKAGEEKLKLFDSKKDIVINLFKVSKLLSEAKNIFIAKYDKAVATKHFIDNGDGTLRVTKAEGFVAVDHTENGIKLVDRLEFSKNNFNAGKPGAKK